MNQCNIFVIFLLTTGLFACQKTPDKFSLEYGYDYFPLTVGKYIEYEVDSTIYDPTGDQRVYTSRTLFREEVVDTLRDNAGNLLYKLERYERMADTLPWQVSKVFTASIQNRQAIITEDNLRFIKMTFPLQRNTAWNGLVHFDPSLIVTVAGESLEMFKGWYSKVESTGVPARIGAFDFGEVATIRMADSENLIEKRKVYEQYVKGIGLVYRALWILDTQCIVPCESQPWEQKAEKGFILTQTVTGYN